MDEVREIALPKALLHETIGHRRAFLARPFRENFSDVENKVVDVMKDNGIQALSFVPRGDAQSVVDGIMIQIEDAHFGIADITGANPNVLAEVGMMMMMADKRVMLLRSKHDPNPLPFDIAHR